MKLEAVVVDRALAVMAGLEAAGISAELGGALALNYHIDDPRTTRDIDVNIALPKERAAEALAALPAEVPWTQETLDAIHRDGQVRIMWPVEGVAALPLDLFFAEHELHGVAHARALEVPLRDQTVRVISATDLTVFKALFGRGKDWVDIEAMLSAHDCSVDLAEAIAWVADIVGASDERCVRLRSLVR